MHEQSQADRPGVPQLPRPEQQAPAGCGAAQYQQPDAQHLGAAIIEPELAGTDSAPDGAGQRVQQHQRHGKLDHHPVVDGSDDAQSGCDVHGLGDRVFHLALPLRRSERRWPASQRVGHVRQRARLRGHSADQPCDRAACDSHTGRELFGEFRRQLRLEQHPGVIPWETPGPPRIGFRPRGVAARPHRPALGRISAACSKSTPVMGPSASPRSPTARATPS